MEFLVYLFFFGIILAVWAVIGHVFWLAAAAIFKGVFGTQCPRCRALYLAHHDCPASRSSSELSLAEELSIVERLAHRAGSAGSLSADDQQQIKSAVATLRGAFFDNTLHQDATDAKSGARQEAPEKPEVTKVPLSSTTILAELVDEAAELPKVEMPLSPPPVVAPRQVVEPKSLVVEKLQPVEHVHPLDAPEPEVADGDEVNEDRHVPFGEQVASSRAAFTEHRHQLTADVLQRFMQQSNIRWIELISASLVVVCSVGLVISLWSTLSQASRFFPSLVFLTATLAVHGAGQYTLRKWNLRSTSRGILHIALMLIPLGVLVGMRMAVRDEQLLSGAGEPLGVSGFLAIAGFMLVYSALAITASIALFPRRWKTVAASVVLASCGLAAINVTVPMQRMMTVVDWSFIGCVASCCVVICWNVGGRAANLLRCRDANARSIAGSFVHVIFASSVLMVFAYSQLGSDPVWRQVWWLSSGGISLVWATLASGLALNLGLRTSARFPGWLRVGAWIVLMAGGANTLLSARYIPTDQLGIAVVVAVLGVWHTLFGVRTHRQTMVAFGSLAVWCGGALLGALAIGETELTSSFLPWMDGRIVAMFSVVGLSGMAISMLPVDWLRPFEQKQGSAFFPRRRIEIAQLVRQFGATGIVPFILACILTFVASLNGATWASWILLLDGCGLIAAGLLCRKRGVSQKLGWTPQALENASQLLVIFGQGLMLVGGVQLANGDNWVHGLVGETLGETVEKVWWCGGVIVVAITWSIVGAVARAFSLHSPGDRRFDQPISILGVGGAWGVLACVVALAAVSQGGFVSLAAAGLIPLVMWLNLLSCRTALWRDLLVLSFVFLCGWCGLNALRHYEMLEPLGLASASAIVVLASLSGLVVIEAALAGWRAAVHAERVGAPESLWGAISVVQPSSLVHAPILSVAWAALLLPIAVAFLHVVGRAWGNPIELSSAQFLGEQFTIAKAALSFFALACVEFMSRSARLGSDGLRLVGGGLPLTACVLLACTVTAENSIATLLWALAAITVALELLQHRVEEERRTEPLVGWLALARGLCLSGMVMFTIGAFVHEVQSEEFAGQWSFLLANILPGAVAMSVGWVIAVREGRSAASLAFFGVSLVSCLAIAGYHLIDEPITVRLIHVFAVSGFALSLLSHSHYALAAKHLSRRVMQGFAQAALVMMLGRSALALVCISLLAAGGGEALYELHVGVLGGLLPLVGLGLALWGLRDVNLLGGDAAKFTVAELPSLILKAAAALAPLVVVAFSANFLALDFSADEGRFAPMHMLVGVWGAGLAAGLFGDLLAFFKGKSVESPVWIALAIPTCILAGVVVVSVRNPWSAIELSMLSAMVLISGKLTSSWLRPYAAAMLASLALLPTYGIGIETLGPWTGRPWYATCGLMIGPLAVIACSMVVDRISHRFAESWRSLPVGVLTLERSGLILVALVSMLMSVAWLVSSPVQSGGLASDAIVCLVVAAWGLLLSVVRVWASSEKQRFFTAYFNALSLSALVSLAGFQLFAVDAPGLLYWGYSILTVTFLSSLLVREIQDRGAQWAKTLGLEGTLDNVERSDQIGRRLVSLHVSAGLLSVIPAIAWVLISDERWVRVAAAVLPLVGVSAVWPLVKAQTQVTVRYIVLGMICIGWVLSWWTFVPNHWTSPAWSSLAYSAWAYGQHALAAMILCGLAYCYYAAWLSRKTRPDAVAAWSGPLYNSGWFFASGGAILGTLLLFTPQPSLSIQVPLAGFTKLVSVFAWLAVGLRLLQFAARPLQLDRWAQDSLRKAAVYGAQMALLVACARVNTCYPQLFDGLIREWWPVAVLLVAMSGGLLSAWLRRRGENILSGPLDNVALLLPLLPIVGLGVWEDRSGIWDGWPAYSVVLLFVSGLYGLHSLVGSRGQSVSVGLRGLSVALLLCSYWSFLCSNPTWSITEHPQFWLLPPALATLLYAEWSKAMLSKEVLAATRYISLLVAYMSSSTEAFLSAFAGEMWQPAILIVLALGGMIAGIVFQVRSFLYCGAVFTFVGLLSMVLQAQQRIGQVWPWWAFGIATGVSLIVALGYMEKNRGRVNQYIARVRGWNP